MFSLIVRLVVILVSIVILMAVVIAACFVVFSVVMISSECKTELCRGEMMGSFTTITGVICLLLLGAIIYILIKWKPWEIPFYLRRKSDRRLEQRRKEEERRLLQERRDAGEELTAEEQATLDLDKDVEVPKATGTSPQDFQAENKDAQRRKPDPPFSSESEM